MQGLRTNSVRILVALVLGQVLALEEGASELPWFAGCQVYPVFPGAASKCVSRHASVLA
jgi:hypothetical protein